MIAHTGNGQERQQLAGSIGAKGCLRLQAVSESAARALELAERRLAEAAAELQRRAQVLQEVSAQRDAAIKEVSHARANLGLAGVEKG